MIKKCSLVILTSVLSCASAHAESLLTLSFNPGYVSNRYSFDQTCNLGADGKLVYTSTKSGKAGSETLKTFTKQIASEEMNQIEMTVAEIRKLGPESKSEYEIFSGDIADYSFAAYASTTEAEENAETVNPKYLGMHYDGISLTKNHKVQRLLVQMSEYCEMSGIILQTSLGEFPKRIKKDPSNVVTLGGQGR